MRWCGSYWLSFFLVLSHQESCHRVLAEPRGLPPQDSLVILIVLLTETIHFLLPIHVLLRSLVANMTFNDILLIFSFTRGRDTFAAMQKVLFILHARLCEGSHQYEFHRCKLSTNTISIHKFVP
jgi:hypothetical protein